MSPLSETPAWYDDAEILIEDDVVIWCGPREDAPAPIPEETKRSLQHAIVTPGWIDCHTHLIWAGSRQHEFRQRIEGKDYLAITKAGGGIMSTVRDVRNASLNRLIELARPRLARFLAHGVTTIEAKSGYGLETQAELRSLHALKALDNEHPIDIISTFLGAHTIPTEHKSSREHYIDLVCNEMLPLVVEESLATYCDIFVEETAFTQKDARKILQKALDLGLGLRLHVDQLSAGGGAELAAEFGAASADHLEEVSDQGIKDLAHAGVVACLIPGSTFCLGQTRYAPARKMKEAGVVLALATDLNPGTTCSENLAFTGTLACIHMRLTPIEVLHAVTRGAAISLKKQDRIGSIHPGYKADIAVFRAPDIETIFYHYAVSHTEQVFKDGICVWTSPTA